MSERASKIYTGWVRHRRYTPVRHGFRYRLYMLYLDLEEADNGLFESHFAWSRSKFGWLHYSPKDYIGAGEVPVATAVRDLVDAKAGFRPTGPVRLLTTVRSFGFGFNPLSVYYCFDDAGENIRAIVASVTNTPWRRRQDYVLVDDADDSSSGRSRNFRAEFTKEMHVSPFNPMDMIYRWKSSEPGVNLIVHLENHRDAMRVFDATLCMKELPAAERQLSKVLFRHPLMAWKNVAAIHFEAFRLFLRRAPIYDNPHD